jgi:hypothetical protein
MTEIAKCLRDLETKRETIRLGWLELAETPGLSGTKRYDKKSAIFQDIDDLKDLVQRLDELTGKTD